MQINQQDLDVQFVELLPERETLYWVNTGYAQFASNAASVNVWQGSLAFDGSAENSASIGVAQGNYNG